MSNGTIQVTGTGTNFLSLSLAGRKLYYYVNTQPVLLGTVIRVNSNTSLTLAPAEGSINVSNVTAGFGSGYLPNQRPALDVLKELAGIEGSVFGSAFSRNFYINRLTDTQTPVQLDYKDVINSKLSRTSLYLGNSVVSQLGVQTREVIRREKIKKGFFDRLFGVRDRYRLVSEGIPDDPYGTFPSTDGGENQTDRLRANRQLPVLARVASGNAGNPRASKELRIELAPAYPLLSKGVLQYDIIGNLTNPTFISDTSIQSDTTLESALTTSGLRNYLRALSSVEGDFIVDFEIKGALSLKPYETFTFTNAPERYQGNVYRVSEIRYNLVGDTVKVKGYKINDYDVQVVPSAPLAQSVSFSASTLEFAWDTTKPVIVPVDITATGISGRLELTCSAGFYSINTVSDDNLWRNTISLNTDGFGRVSARIFVRFNPTARGIVSESLLYGVLQASGDGVGSRVELRANVIAPQSEFYIGQVAGIIGGNPITSITCNMFTEIEQGREITLVGENKGFRYTITPTQNVLTGESTFNIEEQFIEKDRYHVEVSQNADRTGITVSEKEIVLKVKNDGKIAAIRLSSDAEAGSEINIVADQVKINDINFVSNGNVAPAYVGYIESNGFTSGTTGWRINGLGNAEFNDVTVRGTIEANDGYLDNLDVTGALTIGTTGKITSSNVQSSIEVYRAELSNSSIFYTFYNEDLFTIGTTFRRIELDSGQLNVIGWTNTVIGDVIRNSLSISYQKDTLSYPEGYIVLNVKRIATPATLAPSNPTPNPKNPNPEIGIIFDALKNLILVTSGEIKLNSTVDSTSKDTGSIITEGGIGIEKSAYVGTNLRVLGTTESTSTTTGSTVLSGGAGIAKNLHVGGTGNFTGSLSALSTTESTSKDTGSIITEGGVGIEKNLHVGGTGNFTGALRSPVMNMTAITDADSPYTVLATDTHIAVDNNANPVTINLPTGTNGRRIVIFDSAGGAGSGTITINRASTNTINGATSTTLTTAYQSVTLIFNAGNWTII